MELQSDSAPLESNSMRKRFLLWFGLFAAVGLFAVSLYFATTTAKPPLGLLLCPFLALFVGVVIIWKITPA
ncbi:MAG TPA: hypothetical protein VKE98_11045 [Gemmataceae bacterium]|nr:hypothetical protein [Gemmataceae bacterium]